MFDEMDEGTAIFKCANNPPAGVKLCDYEGLPTDHYLWLTGEAGKMLRGEIPFTARMPTREQPPKYPRAWSSSVQQMRAFVEGFQHELTEDSVCPGEP
jgi:hypothetical protein